jgi:hypothetical protein
VPTFWPITGGSLSELLVHSLAFRTAQLTISITVEVTNHVLTHHVETAAAQEQRLMVDTAREVLIGSILVDFE